MRWRLAGADWPQEFASGTLTRRSVTADQTGAVTQFDVVARGKMRLGVLTPLLNGTFADPGLLDTHTVVIHWGDGSANTTLSLDAGVLKFNADHQYQPSHPLSGWDICSSRR